MPHNVLLLQGPVGPFFARFARALEGRGFGVFKVNFNGGDRLFYSRPGAMDFVDDPLHWEAWLDKVIVRENIRRIYVFGDCRRHHRIARELADQHGIRFYVFEEGYIRPNFITLERDGVNGHSALASRFLVPTAMSDAESNSDADSLREERAQPGFIFAVTALYSMAYYLAGRYYRDEFRHYEHHRPLEPLSEGFRWIVSGYRKLHYRIREMGLLNRLVRQYRDNYFVCPLQVHCDMQVVMHSDYQSIEHFITDVLSSFARFAPAEKALVFKHHPMDRGYTDYSRLLASHIEELGLQGRVFYCHDVCLPSLLRQAEGTVLINSTVGLSSLFHGTPVKTMGRAIYNRPGLASQLPLETFWSGPDPVQAETFNGFRRALIERNQVNGNLYRPLDASDPSGLNWSPRLLLEHSTQSVTAPEVPTTDLESLPRLRLVPNRAGSVGIGPLKPADDSSEAA